jgi:hypothetical protein
MGHLCEHPIPVELFAETLVLALKVLQLRRVPLTALTVLFP